jgi:putative ABC transport system permease protein
LLCRKWVKVHLVTGLLVALALVLAAALYPVLHVRRLETVEVLRRV